MEHNMYIYSFSNHQEVVVDALSNKKALLKKRVNRSDNFVNLTLLGVEKCLEDISLVQNTNLYMSSKHGNLNSTMKVLDSIFKKKQRPMPFNFLNSVNASILFFVAKSHDIKGKAIFTNTFESALTQAYVDVQNGKTVLVGFVNEAIADLELHKKKFNTEKIEENSSWLLLSNKIEGKKALAQIKDYKLEQHRKKEKNLEELFTFLETDRITQNYQGEYLSFVALKC